MFSVRANGETLDKQLFLRLRDLNMLSLNQSNDSVFGKLLNLKGLCHRLFSISLNNQNIHLCHGKSENNGPFLLTIPVLKRQKLLASVFGCRWPGWKRITAENCRLNFSSCFQVHLQKINI